MLNPRLLERCCVLPPVGGNAQVVYIAVSLERMLVLSFAFRYGVILGAYIIFKQIAPSSCNVYERNTYRYSSYQHPNLKLERLLYLGSTS
jgi:hypothetical protein